MKRVAVVEDNADNRLLLQALLEDVYEVVEYENGADALAGLAARRPDLVLLDISLPGMDGNEILARIRADEPLSHVPVIALTAHAMAGDREKYLAAGFNDYITKPIVDETILLDAIRRWIASASDSRTQDRARGYGMA
jgi:CheY-like chemotaxis protein